MEKLSVEIRVNSKIKINLTRTSRLKTTMTGVREMREFIKRIMHKETVDINVICCFTLEILQEWEKTAIDSMALSPQSLKKIKSVAYSSQGSHTGQSLYVPLF